MCKSLIQELSESEEGLRLLNQERAILDVTELICEIMSRKNVSRSELAHRLGKSKGYITQLLDGSTNMTIRTVSDVFTALGSQVRFAVDEPQHDEANMDMQPMWASECHAELTLGNFSGDWASSGCSELAS